MTLTANETVSEIVAARPASARVFEKHGIDYCCGGKRPLAEVCAEKGLEPAALFEELTAAEATDNGRDWRSAALGELIDHIIEKHHQYLRQELPEIERKLARVIEVHSAQHGDTLLPLRQVFAGLKDELMQHMMKEEFVLFPMIRRMEEEATPGMPSGATVKQPIAVMEHEHASAGQALAEMRRLTGGYRPPEDACNTFRVLYHQMEQLEADLHVHIHLENNILFPGAAELEASLRR